MKLDDVIAGAGSIAIAGHVRPDGDCVGSSLGVYNYIKENYPDIQTDVYLEEIPHTFDFLSRSEEIQQADPDSKDVYDLFICLDCSDLGRLGPAAGLFNSARRTFCVDHHESNVSFADENYIFPDASSTCELIGELTHKDKISKAVAECLYTGIVTDTGAFQYSCTHRSTMEYAGFLMDQGINYSYIMDHVFFESTYEQAKMLGVAMLRAEKHADGKVISSYVTLDEMQKYNATPKDFEGVVSELRSIRGCLYAAFIYDNGDGTSKGSLRAAGNAQVNLSKVASAYGGGGHAKAAGFTVQGRPEDNIGQVVDDIISQMKKVKEI